MFRTLNLLIPFLIFFCPVRSQVLPKEGSLLNYRLIGFVFPVEKKVNKYRLEIAKGHYDTEDLFNKNVIKTVSCIKDSVISEVPFFAQEYTWRVVYKDFKGVTKKSVLHNFGVGAITRVGTNDTRVRVVKGSKKYKDVYFFSDYNQVLYNMNGEAIWYMPERTEMTEAPRDIKLSPNGTVTFLVKDQAFEINYSWDILWKGPNDGRVSGDTAEHYHHELTRLENGHYMVLGEERVLWKPRDSILGANQINTKDILHPLTPFGTIIEYDAKGNVIWSWKSSSYFLNEGSDIANFTPRQGNVVDVHENAFYFDEKNKIIYVGFKNISRILKVKYPEGTVLNTFGEIFKADIPEHGNGLFCRQHSIRKSKRGALYIFNNNSCKVNNPAEIVMLKEPTDRSKILEEIWEYDCPTEKDFPGIYTTGGNVTELSDNSLFVCMGNMASRLFIVNMNKKIVWSAYLEIRTNNDNKWNVTGQYRANIFEGRSKLEKFVWNAETQ